MILHFIVVVYHLNCLIHVFKNAVFWVVAICNLVEVFAIITS